MELSISTFSGGLTDEVVGAPPNRYIRADNFLVNRDEKLFTRPGSTFFDASYPSVNSSFQEVGGFFNFKNDTELFAMSGNTLYLKTTSGWSAFTGVTGNSAFPTASANARFNSVEWKGHVYISSSAQDYPIKVYKDSTSTWKMVSAGMPAYSPDSPSLVDASMVALINDIRQQMQTTTQMARPTCFRITQHWH